MEVSVERIRIAMETCNKLIPLMNDDEINLIGKVLIKATARLLREGKIYNEQI